MEKVWLVVESFLKTFGTNILEAIALLLLGIIVIKLLVRVVRRLLRRTKMEGVASSFVLSLIQAVLALVLFFGIMNIFNIDTSSIVAIIAASGLAIGLALQDSLSNIASGIILLFTKPFKENDYVSLGGTEGVVKLIKITTTELLTPDNISKSIPNSKVVSSEIINYSTRATRRVDVVVPAAYEEDVDKVKLALQEIVSSDSMIMSTPAPSITVSALGDSAVNYTVKMWVANEDYWTVKNGFFEKTIKKFAEKSIEIPYNKLQVAVKKEVANND